MMADRPRVVAVVLAAGRSRRMGPWDKLLLPVEGVAMVARVAGVLARAGVAEVVIVTRPGGEDVRAALGALVGGGGEAPPPPGPPEVPTPPDRAGAAAPDAPSRATSGEAPVRVVEAADADRGMGRSLARGVEAAGGAHGWLVCTADLPHLHPAGVEPVLGAFGDGGSPRIVVPVHEGRRGHPVLFHRAFGSRLRDLDGDRGARQVVDDHPEAVVEVAVTHTGGFRDVDTPRDWERVAGATLPERGATRP